MSERTAATVCMVDGDYDMNNLFGSGREHRPLQLRLGTMMAVVVGIATLLGVLRLLGPNGFWTVISRILT